MTLKGARVGEAGFRRPGGAGRSITKAASRPDATFDPYVKQSAGVRAFIDAIRDGRPGSPGLCRRRPGAARARGGEGIGGGRAAGGADLSGLVPAFPDLSGAARRAPPRNEERDRRGGTTIAQGAARRDEGTAPEVEVFQDDVSHRPTIRI